jgi:hypothetical protein
VCWSPGDALKDDVQVCGRELSSRFDHPLGLRVVLCSLQISCIQSPCSDAPPTHNPAQLYPLGYSNMHAMPPSLSLPRTPLFTHPSSMHAIPTRSSPSTLTPTTALCHPTSPPPGRQARRHCMRKTWGRTRCWMSSAPWECSWPGCWAGRAGTRVSGPRRTAEGRSRAGVGDGVKRSVPWWWGSGWRGLLGRASG